jgi:alanine dehydrogenase
MKAKNVKCGKNGNAARYLDSATSWKSGRNGKIGSAFMQGPLTKTRKSARSAKMEPPSTTSGVKRASSARHIAEQAGLMRGRRVVQSGEMGRGMAPGPVRRGEDGVLLLREDDVRAVLTAPAAIDVLEAAFRRQGEGSARNVPRSRIQIDGRGVLHLLAAFVPGEPGHPERDGAGVFGFKAYSAFPGSGVRFSVNLYSGEDGRLLALIEADWLGQARTGAASGLATRLLARRVATVAGVIGTGGQARTQVLALAAARPLERIAVYGRDPERQRAFCDEMAALTGIAVVPVERAEDAVVGADVIATATTAREPVLSGAWLRPGTHLNVMGSNWHNRREVDDEAVERSGLVAVDSVEQARIEAGDLLIPAAAGRFDFARAVELGAIVAGTAPGRGSADEITFFKSLGVALEDVAVAGYVYALARERGLGEEVTFVP